MVHRAVHETSIIDIHTHLYAPRFNRHAEGFLLSGIDELLDYHYLHAEVLRASDASLTPERLLGMVQRERADLIWRILFRDRAPLSEACRGVVTTLRMLGLDPEADSLDSIRSWFVQRDVEAHVDDVLRRAGVERVTMTNDVLRRRERAAWLSDDALGRDARFSAVVRLDALLCEPDGALRELHALGHDGDNAATATMGFVSEWIGRTHAVYVAASLPPTEGTTLTPSRAGDRILYEGVLPALAEHGVPLALMIGVRRGVHPALASAGDGSGPSDLRALEPLCDHSQALGVDLLITTLAREDQHGLCVLARKFAHLTPFGCWWFLNTPEQLQTQPRHLLDLPGGV
ncbi:MAG: glucuronate isomerase, partial [Planctomycetota bacterium]